MTPSSYIWSLTDWNIVMWHMTVCISDRHNGNPSTYQRLESNDLTKDSEGTGEGLISSDLWDEGKKTDKLEGAIVPQEFYHRLNRRNQEHLRCVYMYEFIWMYGDKY